MRSAASAYLPMMRWMFQSSACFGMLRWAGSRSGDADPIGNQSSWAQPVRRPRWVIWIMHAAVLLDLIGHAPDPRDDLVLVRVQVSERGRAVLGDDRRARRHRHADSALRLFDVVEPVAVGRASPSTE